MVGFSFLAGVYPLIHLWPEGFRWQPAQSEHEQMIAVIYAVLGIFLIRAARDPFNHLSLVWFTVWSSLGHAAVMAAAAISDGHEWIHLIGDVPALLVAATALAAFAPRQLKAPTGPGQVRYEQLARLGSMNSQHTRTRRGSARALVAVVLLAGVFTMHGLTGNHDAAMAMTHQTPLTAATSDPGSVPAAADHNEHSTRAMAYLGTGMAGPAAPSIDLAELLPQLTALADQHGHLHSMSDVCLAMLAALLLALIVALARRSLAAGHPIQLAGAPVPVAASWPSPLWSRPTLSKLCVLRT